MKWLEIGLTVEEELAEPVAEVLSRHAPRGVAMSPIDLGSDTASHRIVIHAYVEATPDVEHVRQRVEQDLWFLGRIRPLPTPKFTWIEDKDWEKAWKANFRPLLVGRRLRIQPAWLAGPVDDRLEVFIAPGMAFGTGSHPSTQLCLELLEEHVRPGDTIADLGSGSGILSIAAIKLGAARSLAYDTDPTAVSVCRENAQKNEVVDQIEAKLGSLGDLETDTGRENLPNIVVANIFIRVLLEMLDFGLAEAFSQDGKLILSGVLKNQLQDLHQKAGSHGLNVVDTRQREDWIATVLERRSPPET